MGKFLLSLLINFDMSFSKGFSKTGSFLVLHGLVGMLDDFSEMPHRNVRLLCLSNLLNRFFD